MRRCKKAAVFLLCAAVAMAGGCSGQPENVNIVMQEGQAFAAKGEVTLTFYGYKADPLNLVAIENALHSFMDENPGIDIIYEGLKGADYWEAFEKRASSGNMDDIMMVDHDHMMALVSEGKLADLSDLSTIGNFESLAQSQFIEKDGSVYFLPTCITSYGLYINLDLMKEHGQEIPTDMDSFTRVCDYFVSEGITPIIINNYNSVKNLIVAKGMYPVYQKEDAAEAIERFNRGEDDLAETLRPGFELAEMMIQKGWIDCEEGLETAPTSDDLVIFAKGERPFMLTGGWASPRVDAMEPGFEYGVYPYPVLDDGSVLVVDVNTCISVNAGSENVAEAKAFVAYITQPDIMWEYCDSQSSYTPLQDDRIPSDPTIVPCVPYLTNGRFVIGSEYRMEQPIDTYLMLCGEEMMRGMDADGALALFSGYLEQGKGPAGLS